MIYPFNVKKRKDRATIEYLRNRWPYYLTGQKKIETVVMCCGSCNYNRGNKTLHNWFKSEYCIERNINEKIVAKSVKKILKTRKT